MKQIMKHQSLLSGIKSLGIMLSLGLALASCTKDDVVQNPAKPNEEENKNLTTFVAGGENKTRTSMNYNSGDFYWEAGDYIYVKDDDGVLRKSTNAPTGKVASFKYKVPGKFTDHSSYKVYYFGKNSSNNQVVIPSAQSQSTPNNTEHFGVSGDYGTATATGSVGGTAFSFQLEHQAAYLVFHPYVSNTLLQNCYLTKIEVSSDNDIASTYTLNASTGTLQSVSTGAEADKEIILSTKGSGTYANGFPLNTASDNVAVNGAYMVIKPGTHTLKVRYWLKDVSTGIEGTVTKAFKAFNYDVNNYYDIDGNLNIRDYDGDHYYMWDAQEQYWKGFEWTKNLPAGVGQPTYVGQPAGNYPQSNTDARYYNTSYPGYGISNSAIHSCKDLPNANVLSWYCMYGDPRWDDYELWTTMGHLYIGGMWLKKKSVLIAEGHYNTEKSADGTTDLRTTFKNYHNFSSSIHHSGLPSAADAGNYFYLPGLASYYSGQVNGLGYGGNYWSSSADPWHINGAYYLDVNSGSASVASHDRVRGFRVGKFE
ncbi:hypothetical protein [Alloprevotella tannerae]|uniref:hypothetical protein n=1 Tax=Alloprevotella tannerae TaxID=76122 RepID=UPI0028D11E1B|nr:hypothetical protein [Alloprevotella tannerae]